VKREEPSAKASWLHCLECGAACVPGRLPLVSEAVQVPLNRTLPIAGGRPIARWKDRASLGTLESGCLRVQPKAAGKLLLRLNKTARPIANKYPADDDPLND